MSQDAYSPLTGRWGVEGIWDVALVGLAVAALGLLLLAVSGRGRARLLGVLAVLSVLPTCAGVRWLGNVSVPGIGHQRLTCAVRGPVSPTDACGAAYLTVYVVLMVPLLLALVALGGAVAVQIRTRRRAPAAT